MEKKPKQTMRYSDDELSIIKNTFADNDELLRAIRNFILQLPLTDGDKEFLKIFEGNEQLQSVVMKMFLPELDPLAPFGQVFDLWMSVDLKDTNPEIAMLRIDSRRTLINFLDQQLGLLFGKVREQAIVLDDLMEENSSIALGYSNMLARNTAIGIVEQVVLTTVALAGQTSETVQQTKDRLKKDSSK